jgi:hypothetical protein
MDSLQNYPRGFNRLRSVLEQFPLKLLWLVAAYFNALSGVPAKSTNILPNDHVAGDDSITSQSERLQKKNALKQWRIPMKLFNHIIGAALLWAGMAPLAADTVWAAQQAVQQNVQPPAQTQASKPVPDKPEKSLDRVVVVSVQLEGTDGIGARLGGQIKDRFNRSSLFSLAPEEKEGPKLQLLLSTSPEFPGRPGVGSIYSVCWVFSQGRGYLGYLLARDLGTVNYEDVDALTDKLVERTDGVAAKYENLWK